MREYKFRGRKKDGEWVHGYLVVNTYKTAQYEQHESYLIHSGGTAYVIDPDTVGQYTGLKDRNGKEIYEGDVLQWDKMPNVLSVVKFVDGAFWANDIPLYDSLDEAVIGNIHTHPHLLEQGEKE